MAQGFVYVLLNTSFPDLVKIGRTEKTAEIRAKQLQTTGVPTPFIVVYDELVSNCEVVENILHSRFASYRASLDREFFRVPVREAVRALQKTAAAYKISNEDPLDRVEILSNVEQKYGSYLRSNIVSIAIIQLTDICFLEVAQLTYPKARDQIIERMDLSIFGANNGEMFPTTDPIEVNATRFLNELDDYDLIMTGAPLFTSEACNQISYEWEKGGKLKQRRPQ
jgi:T5orf172 domain